MVILIVGLGYVGAALAKRLALAGHRVIGLKRNILPRDGELIETYQGNVTLLETLMDLPRTIESIVYAVSPDSRTELAYQRAYPLGVANIKKVLPQAKFFFVSSTTVYSQDNGLKIDGNSPAKSDTFSAHSLLEAEEKIRDKPSHIILRASGIYGPGRTSMLKNMANCPFSESERSLWTNRIHRDDLARLLEFFINRPDLFGTFLASDPQPAQLGTIEDWFRSLSLDQREKFTAPAQVSNSRTRGRRKSRRILDKKLELLGFSFQYPSFREGYQEILMHEGQLTEAPPARS